MSIHFASFDNRFCGSKEQGRQFSMEPSEVTCERCKAQDRLTITEQGMAYLRSAGYVTDDGRIT